MGSAYALERGDIFTPLIRNLGAIFVRGGRPRDVFAQYMAKASGPTRGRDLNVHFGWLSEDGSMPSVISMLGDMIPILTGAVMAERMKGRTTVALTWIGDGGTSTGAFHEGFNLACVQKAPAGPDRREQQVRLLHAHLEADGQHPLRGPGRGLRLLRRAGGRQRRAGGLRGHAARDRARARGPGPDPDRGRHHAHARPRRARRHEVRAREPCSRQWAAAGPDPALREAAAGRARRHAGRAGRDRGPASTPRCTRTWPRPRPARCPTPEPASTASTPTAPCAPPTPPLVRRVGEPQGRR